MTGFLRNRPIELWWSTRRSQGLLVVTLLPFLILSPLITAVGLEEQPRSAWFVVPLAIAIGVLQLRHSFAAARGLLPKGWPITLLALGLLVYLPLFWYQWDWGSTQCMFLASVAMLLRGRLMNILIITPLLGTFLACVISGWVEGVVGFGMYFYVLVYWGVGLVAGAACLYGTSQLVRAVDDLFATRADMAEMTVGSERLRVSRDLHDLLGQSLSAVSLKGDLALLLLQSDPPAAEAEIRSLTEVAREALRDIRHVVHGEHPVTLRTETQGATALLVAASIDAHIEVELPGLVPEVDELFGWATREGITNILRHSQAAHCSITVSRQQRVALLEIVNDGARYNHGAGTGITGLIERAQLLSGHVTAGPLEDGRFRLSLEIPEAFL